MQPDFKAVVFQVQQKSGRLERNGPHGKKSRAQAGIALGAGDRFRRFDPLNAFQIVRQADFKIFPLFSRADIIERIGPAAALDQDLISYPVVISLDPVEAPLRAGMSASTVIMVEELTDQLLIPNWVVRIDQTTGQPYVFRQNGEENERVDIQLGISYEGHSQVLGGLEEGDVLVLIREASNGFFGRP